MKSSMKHQLCYIPRRPTRGMTRTGPVSSTLPLDSLVTEVHRLLGPTWTLPPYNELLPSYFKRPSSRLQQEDLDFLVRKGALDIPSPFVTEEIFKAYIRHVHPHIPCLDLARFSSIIFGHSSHPQDHGEGKISLLLFHAVMFAGAFFVDLKYLYSAGFLSRRHALDTLFQRVRVLYDLDAEDDRMVVIQSLLLMSYWYDNPDKHKDGRHWIGICVSLAFKAKLHLDDSNHPDWKFRKLLWWSIFTRDRLMSLGLQQPPTINDEFRSSIPVPEIGDCDRIGSKDMTENPSSYYGAHHEKIARIFIEKAKLCLCIKDDLFSPNYRSICSRTVAKQSRISNLWISKVELESWLREVPDSIIFHPTPFLSDEASMVVHLHCAWLKMVYLELFSTLHRQLDFLSEQYNPQKQLSRNAMDCPVLLSAIEFTDIMQDLYEKQLISYLPTTSVPMILRVGIIHIFEAFDTDDKYLNGPSLRRLLHCILALQQLGGKYGGAVFVASLLGAKDHTSVVTSTPDDILKQIDIETLDHLTLRYPDYSAPTVITIREPYDVDIISGLKSRLEPLKLAATT